MPGTITCPGCRGLGESCAWCGGTGTIPAPQPKANIKQLMQDNLYKTMFGR